MPLHGRLQVLHSRDMFDDNGDGTLSIVGQAHPDDLSFQPCVVSQTSILKNIDSVPATSQPTAAALPELRLPKIETVDALPHTAQCFAPWGKHPEAASPNDGKVSIKSERSPVIPRSSAVQPQAPLYVHYPGTRAIRTAIATSNTWETLELVVTKMGGKRGWLMAYQGASGLERHAMIQIVSLPPRNKIERKWLDGISNAHQRLLKGLICILVAIVGIRGPCQACENRVPEKRRHCASLPPQAEDMKELQELLGKQCSECYHLSTKGDCGFPSGVSAEVKQICGPVPRFEKSDTTQSFNSQKKASTKVGLLVRPGWESPPTSPQRVLKTSAPSSPLSYAKVMMLQSGQSQAPFKQSQAPRSHKDSALDNEESSDKPEETDTVDECSAKLFSTLSAAHQRGSRWTHVSETPEPMKGLTIKKTTVKVETTDHDSSSAALVSKALSLLTEVGHLANEERLGVYNKIAEMTEILCRPPSGLGFDREKQI